VTYPLANGRDESRGAPGDSGLTDIVTLYGFSAIYPVLHYILNNVDVFSLSLAVNFALIAFLLPIAVGAASYLVIRPFVSIRVFYILSLISSIAILGFYMRPVYHQLSLSISLYAGVDFGKVFIHVAIFLVLFGLGYGLRRAVTPFLTLLILLAAVNVAYTVVNTGAAVDQDSESARRLTLVRKPSIYILVADGYQNRQGLLDKRLKHLDIGPRLSKVGFRLYENAFSNYMGTITTLRSFFDIEHHYYQTDSSWARTLTGDNKLYSVLRSNGYKTVIAHKANHLIRDHCESDICFPPPGPLGQVQFILAQSLYYREFLDEKTGGTIGLDRYRDAMHRILGGSPSPTVVFSHRQLPSHGPRGCYDSNIPLKKYRVRLQQANNWIVFAVNEIESNDDEAIILVLGDHGALLSDHCNWSNPDTTSAPKIVDKLGILMAIKWPRDYDGRYDQRIHSPIDLSWYLLQYLSDDGMNEREKPMSASYLHRQRENLVYRVVEEGELHTESKGMMLAP
jgi:hypothetical protein